MKKSILSDFGSLLLLATALGQQASAASSREQTLKYWKEETDATSLLGTRMPIICEQSESQRCLHVPVTKSIYQEKTIEEVAGNNYRRKMQGSLSHNSTLYPSPADGSLIAYSPLAIQFAANGISEDTAKFTFTPLGGNQGDAVTVDETVVNSAASVKLGGFDVGSWKWTVEGTNQTYTFEVVEAPQLRSATITNTQVDEAPWQLGGQVAGTSGRLYYASNGVNYACSATAIKDNKSGRSLILTAAHCVWDDVNKKFGVNVLFIPDRDQINETLAGSIGRKCDADVCGCWTASAGVVLERWKTVTWPNRLAYDYGIWIIDDFAAHSGKNCTTTGALDDAVDAFQFDVGVNLADKFTYAFGYSYKYRPDLRYCAEMTQTQKVSNADTWWLDQCGLTPGSSGGPWLTDFNPDHPETSGKIVAVNSYGFANRPGMGAAMVDASAARCLANAARNADYKALAALPAGEEGLLVNCYDRPCVTDDGTTGRKRQLRGMNERNLCQKEGGK